SLRILAAAVSTSHGPTKSSSSASLKINRPAVMPIARSFPCRHERHRTKPAAVRARRDPHDPEKSPSHRLGRAEAALRRHPIHAVRRLLKAAARRLDADALDEARRRTADLACEHPREVA